MIRRATEEGEDISEAIAKERVEEYLRENLHVEPMDRMDQPFVHVHETGKMRCVLCGTGWMSEHEMRSHGGWSYRHSSTTKRHHDNFMLMRYSRKIKWKEVSGLTIHLHNRIHPFTRRANALGLPRWRWHVDSLLLQDVTSDSFGNTDGSNEKTTNSTLAAVENALIKYEKMEKLSLLELAVLKAHCKPNGKTVGKPLAEDRIVCGVQIIIPLVLTFLE